MAGERTPISIQIILATTSGYLDTSFELHHDQPYVDVDIDIYTYYPINYVENEFILRIAYHEDWEFYVVVPDEEELIYHFLYVVPYITYKEFTISVNLAHYEDFDFYLSIDHGIDWNISIYVDYIVKEVYFLTTIMDLQWKDYEFLLETAWYEDVDIFIPTPDYLDYLFSFSQDTAWFDTDFDTTVTVPYIIDYKDVSIFINALSSGELSTQFYMGLTPQYRMVNRIRIIEHPYFGSINFTLIYQNDIGEAYQLFNVVNATINEQPVNLDDPLLTNPIIGNIHRTGEIIDIYVSPVICTSVRMIITETEDPNNIVRLVEFGIYEDIVDTYEDIVHISLDPKIYHLKSLEENPDTFFDIIVINIQPDIEEAIQSTFSDYAFVKFVPTHTPDYQYYLDMIRLHIMQTFYFIDQDFVLADAAPYVDCDIMIPTPGHEDYYFWVADWTYYDHMFLYEAGTSYDDWEWYFKQLADTPLDIDFLTYVPLHHDNEFEAYLWNEDGIEPPFTLQSDIDDILIDIDAMLAHYNDIEFELMVPSYEEYYFFMRIWNYNDIEFFTNVQQGDWIDIQFSVAAVVVTLKDMWFLVRMLENYYFDTEFEIFSVLPYYDMYFEIHDDIPYIDSEFYLLSSRKADGELYGNFNIPQTIKQRLPGAFDIINTPASGELYGAFNIARVFGKAILTIPVLRPDEKERLDQAGIKF